MKLFAPIFVCLIVITSADEEYENKLTKLWSLSSASNSDGSAVVNVTSASIVIQPSSYGSDQFDTTARVAKPYAYREYAFRPRAIPLRRSDQSQIEKNVYYSRDDVKKYKTELLFPGNYMPIAKEKSDNSTQQSGPLMRNFEPKSIPLMRDQEFHKRSLDAVEEPIIEKPEGFSEPTAMRRSISYILGDEDDDDEDAYDGEEYEVEEESEGQLNKGAKKHHKKPKLKPKKLKKYMLPLLLAYKMKYFALVPVMIGGLILLVGATGLAGFFFALFAAVMGLQKGGY